MRRRDDETREAVRGLLKREEDRSKLTILVVVLAAIGGAVVLQSREARRQQDAFFASELRATEVQRERQQRDGFQQRAQDGRLTGAEQRALVEAARERDARARGVETASDARSRQRAESDLRAAHERRERERLAAKERELAAERDRWREEAAAFVRRVLAGQDVGSTAIARDRLGTIAEHIYTTPELAADAREALKSLEGR